MKMRIILKNKGKTVVDTISGKKRKICHLVSVNKWEKGYLKVIYGKDMCNESDWTTKEGLLRALDQYTEKPLMDFIK